MRQPVLPSDRSPLGPPSASASGVLAKLRVTLEMIKFEHSVFALPFALTAALLALRGWPSLRQVVWIVVAMVAARSAAMTFNRIADLKYDASNPRTRMRALPTGKLSLNFAVGFTMASCGLLMLAAWQLNPLALKLSPLAIVVLLGYSYTKRFTWMSHFVLGACLGMSPIAAWIALRGGLSGSVLLLGGAVMLWVAGFDIIYACQDLDFDRNVGLNSLPRRFGIRAALWLSAALHVVMLALLLVVARKESLGVLAFVGVVLVAFLLAYEHSLVKPSDLRRINAAFFTMNGYVSVVFFLAWGVDILAR